MWDDIGMSVQMLGTWQGGSTYLYANHGQQRTFCHTGLTTVKECLDHNMPVKRPHLTMARTSCIFI